MQESAAALRASYLIIIHFVVIIIYLDSLKKWERISVPGDFFSQIWMKSEFFISFYELLKDNSLKIQYKSTVRGVYPY